MTFHLSCIRSNRSTVTTTTTTTATTCCNPTAATTLRALHKHFSSSGNEKKVDNVETAMPAVWHRYVRAVHFGPFIFGTEIVNWGSSYVATNVKSANYHDTTTVHWWWKDKNSKHCVENDQIIICWGLISNGYMFKEEIGIKMPLSIPPSPYAASPGNNHFLIPAKMMLGRFGTKNETKE